MNPGATRRATGSWRLRCWYVIVLMEAGQRRLGVGRTNDNERRSRIGENRQTVSVWGAASPQCSWAGCHVALSHGTRLEIFILCVFQTENRPHPVQQSRCVEHHKVWRPDWKVFMIRVIDGTVVFSDICCSVWVSQLSFVFGDIGLLSSSRWGSPITSRVNMCRAQEALCCSYE